MRVLVCGDRHWTNGKAILSVLKKVLGKNPEESTVIDGVATGADFYGFKAACSLGCSTLRFEADWNRYHRAAGPLRNIQMLKQGKPDLVLAFHNDIESSKGTKHMIKIAKEAGVHVRLFREKKTFKPLSLFLNSTQPKNIAMVCSKATFPLLISALERAGNRRRTTDLSKKENWPKGAIPIMESHEVPWGLMFVVDKDTQKILGKYTLEVSYPDKKTEKKVKSGYRDGDYARLADFILRGK